MKSRILLLPILTLCAFLAGTRTVPAVDGTWAMPTLGNQDWTANANWLNGIIADGIDAAAIFNVNLTNDQTIINVSGKTVGHMFFADPTTSTAGGYALGLLTDVGNFTLDVTSGRSVINVGALGSSKKFAVQIPLVNADGLLKVGGGQLTIRAESPGLTGDFVAAAGLTDTRSNLLNLTSLTIVGGAQFQVDFGNSSPANLNNLLSGTLPVSLGGLVQVPNPAIPPFLPLAINNSLSAGGNLTILGKGNSVNTQTVGSVTFNRGSHTVNVFSGGGASSTIVFDPTTFTRNAGAVVNFLTLGNTTNVIVAGGLANDASGIIGGWAASWTNWATVNGGNAIAPLATYQTGLDPTTWLATDNVSLSATASAPIGTRTINTLRFTGSCTNSIGAGNTLTLADGGVFTTAGIAQITDGTLVGPAGGELIVTANQTNIIGGVIADNTSPSTLIKSGGGLLILSGTAPNTYSGGTFVNQGTLQIGDGASGGSGLALGPGPVTLMGSLQVNGTNDITITNSISGYGLLIKQGSGTLTLSGNNTYNGYNTTAPGSTASGAGQSLGWAATRLDAGTLAVATDTALGGVFRWHNANTTLRSADANTRTLPNNIDVATSPVIIGTPTSGNLIFTGAADTGNGAKTFTVSNAVTRFDGPVKQGAAPGANRLFKNGPGTLVLGQVNNPFTKPFWVIEGTLQISAEGCLGTVPSYVPTQLTLSNGVLETTASMSLSDPNRGITLGGSGTFDVDSGTTLTISSVNQIFGVGANLVKAGAGTLLLQAGNTYSGATFINAGRLALDVSGSISSSSSIIVGNGAVFDTSAPGGLTLTAGQGLGGSGTVIGSITGSGTSVVSPGTASPGTLTLNNNLSLLAGDALTFDLTNNTTAGGGVNDLIQVNGNLNLNNNVVTIRPLAPGGALANGTYRLMNYTGTKTGSLVVNPGTRFTLTIDESTPGQIDLVVSGLPASLVWQGNVNSSWNVGSPANWLNGVNADVFFDFDTVTFNDSAVNYSVSADTDVFPAAMTVNASRDYTMTGPGGIRGTTGLNKGGSGKLILGNAGTNDYTGVTAITNGTLQVGQNDGTGSIGTGPIVNDGTLRFQNSGGPITVSNLSGAGPLYVESGGQDIILVNNNTYSGPTTVSTNARLVLNAALGSTPGSLGNTPGVTVLDQSALFVAVAGNFNQALTLTGFGPSWDSFGALHAGSVNLNWMGPITLAGDAMIGSDGGTLAISNTITGGAFALSKGGAGTVVLAGDSVYGATVISGGVLQIGAGGTNGNLGTGPVTDNVQLTINRSDDLTIANPISGTGALVKAGPNTLTLSGNNTYDGTTSPLGTGAAGTIATRLDSGTLALGSDTALGTGVFRPNTAGVILRCANTGTRTIATTLDIANSFVLGSPDTGDLIWNGLLYSGSAAKTLTISNKVTTFNGVMNGGPSGNNLTKAGPGTLVLNAVNTYDRPTVVTDGLLLVNGQIGTNFVTVSGGALGGNGIITGPVNIQSGGTLSPGASIGTLTISNTLTLAGRTVMEINKLVPGNDLVRGLTSVTYGGTLVVSNLGGVYALNDTFKLFDAAAYSGSFAAVQPAVPASGLAWDTSNLTVDGTLKIVVGLPATPTNINWGVVGGNLVLSWPSDYVGWSLLVQTNNLAGGISTNHLDWGVVPGSAATNRVIITLDPGRPTEFYRMQSP